MMFTQISISVHGVAELVNKSASPLDGGIREAADLVRIESSPLLADMLLHE